MMGQWMSRLRGSYWYAVYSLIAFTLMIVIFGCGGGGGGVDVGGQKSNSPPSISNLQYSPAAFNEGSGGGEEVIDISFAFEDSDGDIVSICIASSDNSELRENIQGVSGITIGSIYGAVSIATSEAGTYTFELWIIDSAGNKSNALTGSITIDSQSPPTPPPSPSPLTSTFKTVIGTDDVVYLLNTTGDSIYRWSLIQNDFLAPISVSDAIHIAYSPSNHRLYLTHQTGDITQIDLSSGTTEIPFATLPLAPLGISAAGNFIMAADNSGAWTTHYIFASDTRFIASNDWNYYSKEYVWSPGNNRLYFFRDDTTPNDLHYEEIDPATGLIVEEGETPYHGDYTIQHPIRVSKSGSKVILGSGDIYDGNTLEYDNSLPITLSDALWMDLGLLSIRETGDGRTLLEQWDAGYTLHNQQYFDGIPIRILEWSAGYVVVTQVGGELRFSSYTPTDDGDGDGVLNDADAFPLDPAASVDTDGDGYPDEWNPGNAEGDSTTGLILDAFPNDSACQLPEHGSIDDPTVCDIANGIPDYVPDQVVMGTNDIIYLLSTANDRIFRWSLTQDYHLNPIDVDSNAQFMAYSSTTQHIYLGYDTGAITQIDLSSDLSEKPFATLPQRVRGLATAGQFVFACDPSGAWDSHYTFSGDGALISSIDGNYYSQEFIWSPSNNRMYFFRDSTSPNDLHYEEIDPGTGLIVDEGETPYHGAYVIQHPIRVSKDGSVVLLGSGDMYDGNTLEYLESMSISPADAQWLTSGLITVRSSPDDNTLLEQWDASYSLKNFEYFAGSPLRVFEWSGGCVVVSIVDGRPVFQKYLPQ